MKASDLKPGDVILCKDPYNRVSYGLGGVGLYKVVKAGRVNVRASSRTRYSPTGPWHEHEHKIPLTHVVRVVRPEEIVMDEGVP